jgi:adenylyl-sulfate kinase
VLDGDIIRTNLSRRLGFSRQDRDINMRRLGFVAQLLSRKGVAVVVAAVSLYGQTRQQVREQIEDFVEAHVECPIADSERRDVKGMYAKARAGHLPALAGVEDHYEQSVAPEVIVHTQRETPEQSSALVLVAIERRGYLGPASGQTVSREGASGAAASSRRRALR